MAHDGRDEIPPAMILCGGQGTRLRDVSEVLPKPMVPVGNQPILWHIMKTYAAFGVRRFILCLGYKRETIIDYFLNYRSHACDLTVRLGPNGGVAYHGSHAEEDWEVVLADTGERAMTGCRVARAVRHLRASDQRFFLTYGDGVADIDVTALRERHQAAGKTITVTAVHPASRFGELHLDGDTVTGFHEKPQTEAGLINGGYMVVEREFVSRYLKDDENLILEQEPMRSATRDGGMAAYVHHGFWQCMDTLREYQLLNQLWAGGNAPWTKRW